MILNLTPHSLVIVKGDKKVVVPKSGYILRASVAEEPAGWITIDNETIPVVKQTLGTLVVLDSEGKELPKEEIKKIFQDAEAVIVPTILGNYKQQFFDLIGRPIIMYAPNTAKAIRDENGRIIGVPSLVEL